VICTARTDCPVVSSLRNLDHGSPVGPRSGSSTRAVHGERTCGVRMARWNRRPRQVTQAWPFSSEYMLHQLASHWVPRSEITANGDITRTTFTPTKRASRGSRPWPRPGQPPERIQRFGHFVAPLDEAYGAGGARLRRPSPPQLRTCVIPASGSAPTTPSCQEFLRRRCSEQSGPHPAHSAARRHVNYPPHRQRPLQGLATGPKLWRLEIGPRAPARSQAAREDLEQAGMAEPATLMVSLR